MNKNSIIIACGMAACLVLAAVLFKNHHASKPVQVATPAPVEIVVEKTNEVEAVKAPAPAVTQSNNTTVRVAHLSFGGPAMPAERSR